MRMGVKSRGIGKGGLRLLRHDGLDVTVVVGDITKAWIRHIPRYLLITLGVLSHGKRATHGVISDIYSSL